MSRSDLKAQIAPGAGAWLSLPVSNTTINDGLAQQDPQMLGSRTRCRLGFLCLQRLHCLATST